MFLHSIIVWKRCRNGLMYIYLRLLPLPCLHAFWGMPSLHLFPFSMFFKSCQYYYKSHTLRLKVQWIEGAMNRRFIWYHHNTKLYRKKTSLVCCRWHCYLCRTLVTIQMATNSYLPVQLCTKGWCSCSALVKFSYLIAVTLSGMGGEQFRGLLVQGRQVAEGSPVGTFINFDSNTQASQCTPPMVLT